MPDKYVTAIDQGTSSTRCIIFGHEGNIISSHQLEHQQIFPQAGWVEHNPLEIWGNTQKVIQATLRKADLESHEIAAIGITDQRETTIVWNRKTGQPYYNAIVWQCTRTRQICDYFSQDGGPDRFRSKTGLPLSAYFSGPKIKWILDNIPGVRLAAERGEAIFGNIDTWLIWWLTGGPVEGKHVTDVTNASRTLLMNLYSLDWDEEVLKIMGIPRQMLPEIHPSSEPGILGYTRSNGPFEGSIPITGDIGDQQSALVGQACYNRGEIKNTYGTGGFILMNTGDVPVISRSGLLTTPGYKLGNSPPVYCLEGSIAIAGAIVQWLRDNLGLIEKSSQIESLARTVEDNGGIYFVPAFSGLFAPYWRSDARGIIVGLTRYINKGHIARAALEATAYQSRDILDVMEKESGIKFTEMKVDGGMVCNDLLMQFQADILGKRIVRSRVTETTALGAAYMAGIAVGFWNNLHDLQKNWKVDKIWEPQMGEYTREKLYQGWQKAVQRTFNWVE